MASAQQQTSVRQLSIKTGVVTRLVRELQSYKDEASMLDKRAQKMQDDGEDEYEVRQQRRVHSDSLQMIPDSEKRLAKATEELEDLVDALEEELDGSDELNKAKGALKLAHSPPSSSSTKVA